MGVFDQRNSRKILRMPINHREKGLNIPKIKPKRERLVIKKIQEVKMFDRIITIVIDTFKPHLHKHKRR